MLTPVRPAPPSVRAPRDPGPPPSVSQLFGPDQVRLVERWSAPGIEPGPPAVAPDGSVAFVEWQGDFHERVVLSVLRPQGQPSWQQDLARRTESANNARVSVDDERVVAVNGQETSCYDLAGAPRWKAPYGSHYAPVLRDGRTYLAALDGTLVCLNERGQVEWKVAAATPEYGANSSASPVVGPDGTVYHAAGLHKPNSEYRVFVVSPTGEVRHELATPYIRDMCASPEGVRVATWGRALGVGPEGERWSSSDESYHAVEGPDGSTYLQGWETVTRVDPDGRLYRMGTEADLHTGNQGFGLTPLEEGWLLLTNLPGREAAIVDRAGFVRWKDHPGRFTSPPEPGPGGLLYAARDCSVVAFELTRDAPGTDPREDGKAVQLGEGWVLVGGVRLPRRSQATATAPDQAS